MSISESRFINQYLSVKNRTQQLSENERQRLDEISSLKKSSTNPRHLTIVHDQLAKNISNIILNRAVSPTIFAEFNPGFGLVTKNLVDLIDQQPDTYRNLITKCILVESFSKFDKFSRQLATRENVFAVRQKPFSNSFMFRIKSDDHESRRFADLIHQEGPASTNLSVFGVLPWNCKGYLTKIMGDFASNRCLFSFDNVRSTEMYFYVPEIVLAKLKPDLKRSYNRLNNSSLGVLTALLTSKLEVVDERTCDSFFPFPILANPNKYKREFQRIDFNKMFLVSLKFERPAMSVEEQKNKRLLYLFVSQMFVRPTVCLKDALKSVKSPLV